MFVGLLGEKNPKLHCVSGTELWTTVSVTITLDSPLFPDNFWIVGIWEFGAFGIWGLGTSSASPTGKLENCENRTLPILGFGDLGIWGLGNLEPVSP